MGQFLNALELPQPAPGLMAVRLPGRANQRRTRNTLTGVLISSRFPKPNSKPIEKSETRDGPFVTLGNEPSVLEWSPPELRQGKLLTPDFAGHCVAFRDSSASRLFQAPLLLPLEN